MSVSVSVSVSVPPQQGPGCARQHRQIAAQRCLLGVGHGTLQLPAELQEEIYFVLLLTPDEVATSTLNEEFENPVPSLIV